MNIDDEAKLKVREAFKKIYKEEKKARDQMEKYVRDNASRGKVPVIEEMKDRENVLGDAHQCFYCTDFAYISHIKCNTHKIHYCLYH